MRLICISDTHNNHRRIKIPDGDILIHAGDAGWTGSKEELEDFAGWFRRLPHKVKIFVPGNHDGVIEEFPQIITDRGIHLLVYNQIVVEGLRFYDGTFYAVSEERISKSERWASFKITETWAEHVLREAPKQLDILVSHSPPKLVLDYDDNRHWGCLALLKYVEQAKPKLHVFGHVHGARGSTSWETTTFLNVACHTFGMNVLVNGAVVYDI